MKACKPKQPPLALTFSALDPTGGAGLQADILTLGALGCHAISVATAVTAQDLSGVAKVWPLPADQVEKQCSVALGDVVPSVVKIGVVGTAANARSIAQLLTRFPQVPVVWDPVLASGRGDSLAKDSALMTFRRWLLPRCFLVTPNRGELFKLAGGNDVDQCANLLLAEGVANVLVTDVAGQGQKVEQKLYANAGKTRSWSCPRLPGNYHGTGCRFASSLAARLAMGDTLGGAVAFSVNFLYDSIMHAYSYAGSQPQAIPALGDLLRRKDDD